MLVLMNLRKLLDITHTKSACDCDIQPLVAMLSSEVRPPRTTSWSAVGEGSARAELE
jgi:hypothetical protein